MITDKTKNMVRKYWTIEEEEKLIKLYDKYKDKNGNFLSYKVKKSELISGRSIGAHSAKLRNDYNVTSIGSSKRISHKLDYEAIYEAHKSGCTLRQIGKDFGISHQSVRVALDKYKRVTVLNEPAPRSGWSNKEDEALIQFVKNNTRRDGQVMWRELKEGNLFPYRTKIAVTRRWDKILKADYTWNGKNWVYVEPNKAKVQTSKVKLTRRSFLWGLYTIEKEQ